MVKDEIGNAFDNAVATTSNKLLITAGGLLQAEVHQGEYLSTLYLAASARTNRSGMSLFNKDIGVRQLHIRYCGKS